MFTRRKDIKKIKRGKLLEYEVTLICIKKMFNNIITVADKSGYKTNKDNKFYIEHRQEYILENLDELIKSINGYLED